MGWFFLCLTIWLVGEGIAARLTKIEKRLTEIHADLAAQDALKRKGYFDGDGYHLFKSSERGH